MRLYYNTVKNKHRVEAGVSHCHRGRCPDILKRGGDAGIRGPGGRRTAPEGVEELPEDSAKELRFIPEDEELEPLEEELPLVYEVTLDQLIAMV